MENSLWTGVETPLIVYGIDSPTYNERAIDSFGPNSAPSHLFHGSAIVITGGTLCYKRVDASSHPYVYLSSLTSLTEDMSDLHFTEDVITELIDLRDCVTMVHWKAFQGRTEWSANARVAGMSVFETLDAVVCVGNGESLRRFHWVDELTHMGITIMASKDNRCSLADALIDAASISTNSVGSVFRHYWDEVHSRPRFLEEALEGCHLFAGTRDPDGGSLAILRTQTDTADAKRVLSEASAKHDFSLYFVENLTAKDESQHCFLDFEQWNNWSPLPENWHKVR